MRLEQVSWLCPLGVRVEQASSAARSRGVPLVSGIVTETDVVLDVS